MPLGPVRRLSDRTSGRNRCSSSRSGRVACRLCGRSTRRWRGPCGMNAGSTMERVYLDLKARIVGGAYPPGTRLDPFHLAKRLAASPTPVREALHRLSGGRIVDSWHQEGFSQPTLAESDLCDHYRSEKNTSESQSVIRISSTVYCLKK